MNYVSVLRFLRTMQRSSVAGPMAIAIVFAGCGGSDSSETGQLRITASVVVPVPHRELTFDASRSLLYTTPLSPAPTAQIVSINVLTGEQRVALMSPLPSSYGSLSISRSARYLYASGPTLNSATRFDLDAGTADVIINAPAATGLRSEVRRVLASPVDDAAVFAQLAGSGASSAVISFGLARDAVWQQRWVDAEAFSFGPKLAVRADASELVSTSENPPFLRLVQLRSDGAEVVRAAVSVDPMTVSLQPPHFTSQGVLWGARIYDGSSLAVLFDIPGAVRCAALPSPDRVACVDRARPVGHALFVYDLRLRQRTDEWTAGFNSGSEFTIHDPVELVFAGPGRVAISYTTFARGFGVSPSQVAIYNSVAFN